MSPIEKTPTCSKGSVFVPVPLENAPCPSQCPAQGAPCPADYGAVQDRRRLQIYVTAVLLLVACMFIFTVYFWDARRGIAFMESSPVYANDCSSCHNCLHCPKCYWCDLIGCRVNSECRHCSKCKNCLANGFCGQVCGVRNLPQQMQLYGQDC